MKVATINSSIGVREEVCLNPGKNYYVQEGDMGFVIAQDQAHIEEIVFDAEDALEAERKRAIEKAFEERVSKSRFPRCTRLANKTQRCCKGTRHLCSRRERVDARSLNYTYEDGHLRLDPGKALVHLDQMEEEELEAGRKNSAAGSLVSGISDLQSDIRTVASPEPGSPPLQPLSYGSPESKVYENPVSARTPDPGSGNESHESPGPTKGKHENEKGSGQSEDNKQGSMKDLSRPNLGSLVSTTLQRRSNVSRTDNSAIDLAKAIVRIKTKYRRRIQAIRNRMEKRKEIGPKNWKGSMHGFDVTAKTSSSTVCLTSTAGQQADSDDSNDEAEEEMPSLMDIVTQQPRGLFKDAVRASAEADAPFPCGVRIHTDYDTTETSFGVKLGRCDGEWYTVVVQVLVLWVLTLALQFRGI